MANPASSCRLESDAAIARAPGSGVIGCDWYVGAKAMGEDLVRLHAALDKGPPDGIGACLAEAQVQLLATLGIRMPTDFDRCAGTALEDRGHPVQRGVAGFVDDGAAGRELD